MYVYVIGNVKLIYLFCCCRSRLGKSFTLKAISWRLLYEKRNSLAAKACMYLLTYRCMYVDVLS